MIRLGKDPVTSDFQTSPETEEEVGAAALVDHVRQFVLTDGAWSFSLKRIPLDTDPSYSKFLGTGDRTDYISVSSNITWDSGSSSNLVNGNTTADSSNGVNTPTTIAVDDYILFDFGYDNRKNIEEVKIYAETGSSLGEWTFEASDIDDDDEYVEQKVSTLDFTSSSPQLMTFTPTDASGFRYWRLRKTTASASVNKFITEFEFKIASGSPEGMEYSASYDLPSSVLRVINLCDDNVYSYVVEDYKVKTNGAPSWAFCVVDVNIPARWSPLFGKAFYLYLAHELAYHFRADQNLKDRLYKDFMEAMDSGMARDSQQSSNRVTRTDGFIEDR